jgi:hypothetical protein
VIAKRINRAKGTSDFGRLVNYLLDVRQNPELPYQTPEAYALQAGSGEKVAWFRMEHCDSDTPAFLVAEVKATQALNTRSKSDKTYHLVVSFPEGEQPNREVIRDIEQTLCEGVGLGNHQRLLVVHQDTAHLHLHIAINKVHPESLRCVEPYYDHYQLNDLCRALEKKHHLQKDNRIEPDKERNPAQEQEAHSGEQSLISWLKTHVKEELLACIQNAQDWQTVHETLGQYGLEMKPKGAGLVIGIPEKSLYIKASSLSRKLSFKSLTEQLGAYVASSTPLMQDPAKPTYEQAPKQKHPAAQALYVQYQNDQKTCREERSERLLTLRSEEKQYMTELKRWYDRQYQRLRYEGFLTGADKRARHAQLARQRREDMANQRNRYAHNKQAIIEQTQTNTWTAFLIEQAKVGNEKALSILRSQKSYQVNTEQPSLTVEHPAKTKDVIYPGLKPVVLKDGTTLYQLKDGGQVRDGKSQIQVPEATERAATLALMLAQERFPGQRLTIEGSPEFKEQLIEIVAKQSLNVSFTDKQMEQKRRQVLLRNCKMEKMLEIKWINTDENSRG